MKTLTILSFLALLLSVGCSTTYYLPRDPDAKKFVHARSSLEGCSVIVMPVEGSDSVWQHTQWQCDSLTFHSDTLNGYDHDTQLPVKVPLSHISGIVETDVWRGMERGASIGGWIGTGTGALLGAAFCIKQDIPSDFAFVVGTGIAGMGTVTGAIVGAIMGAFTVSTDRYTFLTEDDPRIWRDATFEDFPPSHNITLNAYPLQYETREAICILWNGKHLWLTKSKIKFDWLADGTINLIVPKNLLEPPPEK